MEINKIIGQKINTLLAEKNLNQKDLAKELGVQDNVVSYWCKGTRKPNYTQIIQMSNIFNVSSDYLLGITETQTRDKDLQYICDYTGLNEETVKFLNETLNIADDEFLTLYTRLNISKHQYRFFLKVIERALMSKKTIHSFAQYYNDLFKCLMADDKEELYFYNENRDAALYKIMKSFSHIIENYGTELFEAEFLELEKDIAIDGYKTIEEAHEEGLFNE